MVRCSETKTRSFIASRGASVLIASMLMTQGAAAQPCQPTWLPVGGGLGSDVLALAALADGSIAAGTASMVVRFDGSTWVGLGSGMNGAVSALAALPNGDLVAGGSFTDAGGVPANYVARWDGTAWSPLGSGVGEGVNGTGVRAMAVLPNGDLVVGGNFTVAGGIPASRIARWDGSAWWPLGQGATSGSVIALAVLPGGDLVASGRFAGPAGGQPVTNIARWNGTTWSALGSGVNGGAFALAGLPNGDVVAGGMFDQAGGVEAYNIARWDGSSWSSMCHTSNGGNPHYGPPWVRALQVLPNGDLVVGGGFLYAGNAVVNRIGRWDGSAWHPFGSGITGGYFDSFSVNAIALEMNGSFLVGGRFDNIGGLATRNIARWGCAPGACYANCDGSTGNPALTPADFVCFLNRYRAGDPYANCDGSTGNPALTPADFVCFLNRFRAGC